MKLPVNRGATVTLDPSDRALLMRNLNNSFDAIRQDVMRMDFGGKPVLFTVSYQVEAPDENNE